MIPSGHVCGLRIKIERANRDVWEYFRQYHYKHNPDGRHDKRKNSILGAHLYVATLPDSKDEVVGCVAARPAFIRGALRRGCNSIGGAYRESRLVVLPEYQGCGIGSAIGDAVAQAYVANGCSYTSSFLHPALYKHRAASSLWQEQPWSGKSKSSQPTPKASERHRVPKFAFRFVGEGLVRERLLAGSGQERRMRSERAACVLAARADGARADGGPAEDAEQEQNVVDLKRAADEMDSSTEDEAESEEAVPSLIEDEHVALSSSPRTAGGSSPDGATEAATAAAPAAAMEQALAVRRELAHERVASGCNDEEEAVPGEWGSSGKVAIDQESESGDEEVRAAGVRVATSEVDRGACALSALLLGVERPKGVPEALRRCIAAQVYSPPDAASTDSSFSITTTSTDAVLSARARDVLLPCASVDEDLEEVSV